MSEKRGGCFKRSCFGCMAVLGLFFVGFGLIAAISFIQGGGAEVRERPQVEHSLPAPVSFVPPAGDGLAGSGETTPFDVPDGELGRVMLDVGMADFKVVAAEAGEPLRLDADYDSSRYKLEESFEQRGEAGWSYELSFDSRRTFNFFFNEQPDNELTLYLPVDVPIVIEGQIGIGSSRLNLGGMWLESIDLDVGIGEHRIDFDKPLRQPMRSLTVESSIGEFRVHRIGNASPQDVRVEHSIGEVYVGLEGAWRNDASVRIESSIGECSIGLPGEEVRLDVRSVSTTIGDSATHAARDRTEAPETAATVSLSVSHSIGEVRFTR